MLHSDDREIFAKERAELRETFVSRIMDANYSVMIGADAA